MVGYRPKVIVIIQNLYYNITMPYLFSVNKWKGFEIMIAQNAKLAKKRKEMNMSQREVAQHINICKRSYERKEFGHNQFTQNEIKRLMELLDADFNELF